jgi:hypothetical protein
MVANGTENAGNSVTIVRVSIGSYSTNVSIDWNVVATTLGLNTDEELVPVLFQKPAEPQLVTIKPAGLDDVAKAIQELDPDKKNPMSQASGLAKSMNIDVNKPADVARVGKKSVILNVDAIPPNKPVTVQGNIFTMMQFTSAEKNKYDIVQNVTWTVSKNGQQVGDPSKLREGWQTNESGVQMGFDRHAILGPTFKIAGDDTTMTVTGVFQLGLGTVTGTPQTKRYVSEPVKADKPGVKFLDDKFMTYKVVLTINKDGSWTFMDESVGIDMAVDKDGQIKYNGKLTQAEQEKLIYTVVP